MPLLRAKIVADRTVVTWTSPGSPTSVVGQKVSARTTPLLVLATVTTDVIGQPGLYCTDVRVVWGGDDLARARQIARRRGGTVWRRDGGTYVLST